MREHDVREIRFCATSAARDAENSGGVRRAACASASASSPRCSTGLEEARVSFAGATRDLPPVPEPLLVIDIGGGSTELILGNADGTIVARDSLDIGSVRLNERHLADDPPSQEQIQAAVADIDAATRRLLGRSRPTPAPSSAWPAP